MEHFGSQWTDFHEILHLSNFFSKMCRENITAKATLKFGSEAWVLNKREEQRLEAEQVKFLRNLLGITKLDKKKESMY